MEMDKLLKIGADELVTVRLVCQAPNCGAVLELPWERLVRLGRDTVCPACDQPWLRRTRNDMGPLAQLAHTLREVRELDLLKLEFVVPAPGEDGNRWRGSNSTTGQSST